MKCLGRNATIARKVKLGGHFWWMLRALSVLSVAPCCYGSLKSRECISQAAGASVPPVRGVCLRHRKWKRGGWHYRRIGEGSADEVQAS